MSLIQFYMSQGWDKMADWIQLMFDFKKTMTDLAAVDETMERSRSTSSLVTLLRLVAHSNQKNAYHSIENNLLHAALYVNILNSIAFAQDQLPELPSDVHKSQYP